MKLSAEAGAARAGYQRRLAKSGPHDPQAQA
jgi:hypothetical protein